jgi:hypothetical protein
MREPSGKRLFTDGQTRSVYIDSGGNQFVIGYEGERVYGTWLHPDECPAPDVVSDSSIHDADTLIL